MDLARAALLVVIAGLVACSSGSGARSSDGSADSGFVGTWTVIGGSGTYHCPDSTDPWPNPATVYVLAGADANEVTSSNPDDNACTLSWNVNGSTATLVRGTCSFYSTTVSSGEASISATGMLSWSISATTPDPPCTGTETITAMRKTE